VITAKRVRNAAVLGRRLAEQRLGARLPGGVILLYHRVTTLEADTHLLAVTPERFRAHMELLRERYVPMPLGRLVHLSRRGQAPRGAVAVTFDDGYADNLLEAEPILRATGVPATVFVATGHVESGRELWWDELEDLILLGHERPGELRVAHAGEERRWPATAPDERRTAHDELHPWLRFAPIARREDVLGQVRAWAGRQAEPRVRDAYRLVTRDELRTLAASPVVDVAPHTQRHPALAHQDAAVQADEIRGSDADLRGWAGVRAPVFSYPFGGPGADYDDVTLRAVRAAGFGYAVANFPARVTPLSGRYEVPRLLVRDWDADEFAAFMERWA
jgi:peptidoglycan/xylan/chitin deacetylase (PgdA/CDA1 family)